MSQLTLSATDSDSTVNIWPTVFQLFNEIQGVGGFCLFPLQSVAGLNDKDLSSDTFFHPYCLQKMDTARLKVTEIGEEYVKKRIRASIFREAVENLLYITPPIRDFNSLLCYRPTGTIGGGTQNTTNPITHSS